MTVSIDHITPKESVQERVPREIAERFEAYRTDPDLLELVARLADERNVNVPDPTESETSFMAASQAAFDFRQGKKREELEGGDLSQDVKDLAEKLVDKYDMRRNTEPKDPDVDAAIVLGAAGVTPRTRLEYLVDLMDQGKVNTSRIVMVAGERQMDMRQDKNGQTEVDRAGEVAYNFGGEPAATEFDLMRNTVAKQFNVADNEWEYYEGDDPNVPHEQGFHTTWRFARAYKDGKEILVTSAPMIDEDRYSPADGSPRNRANTIDSWLFAARILQMGKIDGGKLLGVTNSVFVPFQHADAQKALTGYGINVETVGMNREYSGLPEWQGGDIGYYIQEILSAIRQTKFARDRLVEQ